MKITTVGLDIAKRVFQLHGVDAAGRAVLRRKLQRSEASTPCSWKTRLAMSNPTVVISIVDGSFSLLHSTARAWHIDAVRGRPPHQILSASGANLTFDTSQKAGAPTPSPPRHRY